MRGALSALVVWLAPSVALAHPVIDEGRALLERAEFEAALETLATAADAGNLTREDVVELLEIRAMAHVAVSDMGALSADIAGLASLDPGHVFPPEAPPELQGMLESDVAASPPLGVDVTMTRTDLGVRVDAAAANDRAGLVEALRVYVRSPGEAWRPVRPGSLVAVAEIAYYAEAVGLGGAVLAHAGTLDAPLTWDPEGSRYREVDEGAEGGGSAWPWILLGAGALAVGAVVAILLVAGGSGGTQPSTPVVIGF